MTGKNNGHKKNVPGFLPQDFISHITVIDQRTGMKIFEAQMTLTKAVAQLQRVNDLKLEQCKNSLREQQEQAKRAEKFFRMPPKP